MSESDKPDTRLMPLTQGKFAIVDAADFEWLSRWKWSFMKGSHNRNGYAARGQHINGKLVHVLMHREILGLPKGERFPQGDHRDSNGLNNVRSNLRVATHQQNMCNRKTYRNNTTGFKGVTVVPNGRFRAIVNLNKKPKHLGYFDSAEEAAGVYLTALLEFHGDFACLS
jgi:hypothetical protein